MKNLLTKIAAPLLIIRALSGQPTVAEAEPHSGINLGIGVFSSAEEAVTDYYKLLMGAKIGVDTRINDYLRFTTNLSINSEKREDKGVERQVSFLQLESMPQLVGKGDIGYFYGGAGLSLTQVTERASSRNEDFEMSESAGGIVLCGGIEFVPEKGTKWGGFAEVSYRKVMGSEGTDFGGTTLMIGAKYFFGK